MNSQSSSVRRFGQWLSVGLIAAGALAAPAVAQVTKQFGLSVVANPTYSLPGAPGVFVDPTTAGAQINAPLQMVATFTNLAPPSTASSNISSMTLSMAVPGMSILSSPAPTGSGGGTIVVTSPTTITISNSGPVKGQGTYILTFYVSSCGDTTWTGTATTGSQPTNGQPFTLVQAASQLVTLVSCGLADCRNQAMFSVVDTTINSSGAYLTGVQSAYNKDGVCANSTYYVSNQRPINGTAKTVHFRWPVSGTGSQPTAVWRYDVTLQQLPGSPPATPRVAWLNTDGSPATASDGSDTPAFIDPLTCLSAALPTPYGTLANSVSAGSNKIKVNSNLVFTQQFDIVIERERMTVLAITNGGNWTVQRGVGNTAQVKHVSGLYVMSTPLPIFPSTPLAYLADGTGVSSPYHQGDIAQVCKTSPTIEDPPGSGNFVTPLIDSGDSYIKPTG